MSDIRFWLEEVQPPSRCTSLWTVGSVWSTWVGFRSFCSPRSTRLQFTSQGQLLKAGLCGKGMVSLEGLEQTPKGLGLWGPRWLGRTSRRTPEPSDDAMLEACWRHAGCHAGGMLEAPIPVTLTLADLIYPSYCFPGIASGVCVCVCVCVCVYVLSHV